jgi:branched-chain amino acid transport system permease protein
VTPYIVGGLVVGGVYAIAALGLIITYSSSRVFNFAHGVTAYVIALTFHEFAVGWGWNKLLAAAVAVLVVSPLLGLGLWGLLFRRLTNAAPTVRLVSTIGLWVALPPLARILYGSAEIVDRTGVGPSPSDNYTILGVAVNSDQVIVLVAVVVIAILLTLLLKTTSFGLSVRATVDSPITARIVGINTSAVTAGSWMIGTTLAGLAGVLLVPLTGYYELQFTFLVLAAFAACVVARMRSLVLGVAGAMLIGLLQNIVQSQQVSDFLTHFFPANGVIMNNLPTCLPFIVMIIFLLSYSGMRREAFVSDTRGVAEPEALVAGSDAVGVPKWRRLLPFAITLVIILALPQMFAGLWLLVIAEGLALGIVLLSYTIVVGEGGMISLCQATFAGIGGAVAAQLAANTGMSILVAILIGGLIAVPIGLLAALPSLRLGDLYLALATLAFGILVENTYYNLPSLSQDNQGAIVPRPALLGIGFSSDKAFYYLLVVMFILIALFVVWVRRSTSGLVFSSVRSSEVAAATSGISIVRAKLLAFGASAFVAGIGGGLYVTAVGRSIPAQQFATLLGVVWLAIVVTWGVRSPIGALAAGLSFTVIPFFLSQHLSGRWLELPTVLFGLGAIGLAREPRGVVYQITHGHRSRSKPRAKAGADGSPPARPSDPVGAIVGGGA